MYQKLCQVSSQIIYLSRFFPPYKRHIKDNGHSFEYLKSAIARETQYWGNGLKMLHKLTKKLFIKKKSTAILMPFYGKISFVGEKQVVAKSQFISSDISL